MNRATRAGDASFLAGESEMARRIRLFDWSATPLGVPGCWSASLKAMVRMALTTQHPIFIFWGPERVCLYNDGYSASLGREKHPSILGMHGQAAWPEIWHLIGPQIDLVMRGDGATWHENQLVPFLRHGRIEDVYWTYSYGPIDDALADSGVGGVLVICTETTEQVKSKERIAFERARFAELFEQAPTFMAILRGPDHVFELANPGYMRLVQQRPVVGKRVADALPNAAAQGLVELLDGVYRSGQAHSVVGTRFDALASDGPPASTAYLDFVYQPIRDAGGAVSGIFVEGVDVTQRRATELQLRSSEDRFRLAVESSSLGTFDIDCARARVALSASAQQLFDLPDAEVGTADCLARVHPHDRAAVEATIRHRRDGPDGADFRIKCRIVRGDGALRWVDAAGRLSRADGVPGGERMAGVLWDVTEQQQLIDTLRSADRRKDEFVATLAHELRNPLAPIRTAAHLLAQPALPAERAAWCVGVIQRHAGTMALLLEDLMDIARITSGKLVLKPVRVELRAIVDAAIETARPTIDERGHRLQVTLPPPSCVLQADPLRLAQVLSNLLTNAAKYTDPGGAIELIARAADDAVAIEVHDNGIGIDAAALPAIFEMFQQVKGTLDRAQGGLGIGLALSRGLVELHGGTIGVSSAGVGCGSTFRVTLPLAQR